MDELGENVFGKARDETRLKISQLVRSRLAPAVRKPYIKSIVRTLDENTAQNLTLKK